MDQVNVAPIVSLPTRYFGLITHGIGSEKPLPKPSCSNAFTKLATMLYRTSRVRVVAGIEPLLTGWRDLALCSANVRAAREHDGSTADGIDAALTRCQRCPVIIECLSWALSEPYFEGVAGGQIFRPKAQLIRREAAAARRQIEGSK